MKISPWWTVLSTGTFYGMLWLEAHYLPSWLFNSMGVVLVGLFGGILLAVLWHQPLEHGVYAIAVLVPLEFSAALGSLPRLSPIDYLCAITAVCIIGRTPTRSWITLIRECFGGTSSLLWACFIAFSIANILHSDGSFRPLLRWLELLYAFFLASLAVRESPGMRTRLPYALGGLGVLTALMGCKQFFESARDYRHVYAAFKQHNIFAAFLSLCTPALAYCAAQNKRLRMLYLTGVGLCLLAMGLSFSRGAWIGLIFGTVTVGFLRMRAIQQRLIHPTVIFGLIFVFFVIGVAFPLESSRRNPLPTGTSDDSPHRIISLSQRPTYWQAALDMVTDHPALGVGPGNFHVRIPDYLRGGAKHLYNVDQSAKNTAGFWQHLHSVYLQIIVDYGLIGFLLWTLAMASLIGPSFLSLQQPRLITVSSFFLISITAFLVHNTVDILFVSSLDLLFVFLLACSRTTTTETVSA